MKEINLHYFVPENHRELESLVGKIVGVKLGRGSAVEQMVYAGPISTSNETSDEIVMCGEFIRQMMEHDRNSGRDYPRTPIIGFRQASDSICFNEEGIVLDPSKGTTHSYYPTFGEYNKFTQSLKASNLWMEP